MWHRPWRGLAEPRLLTRYSWRKRSAWHCRSHQSPRFGWPARAVIAYGRCHAVRSPPLRHHCVIKRQQRRRGAGVPENVIDADPGGQPSSFSVNATGWVVSPLVCNCFVGQVPNSTDLLLSLAITAQVKSTTFPRSSILISPSDEAAWHNELNISMGSITKSAHEVGVCLLVIIYSQIATGSKRPFGRFIPCHADRPCPNTHVCHGVIIQLKWDRAGQIIGRQRSTGFVGDNEP